MRHKIFPDIYLNSIFELPVDKLKKKGIKALVFDIDNTLVPHFIKEADDSIVDFFKALKAQGFIVAILSNNNKKRVGLFNGNLKVKAIHRAGKPGSKKLLAAIRELGVKPQNAALIGDQIFTDVWCAHGAGLLSIMTRPISKSDQLITKVKRPLERLVMSYYFKRRNKNGA